MNLSKMKFMNNLNSRATINLIKFLVLPIIIITSVNLNAQNTYKWMSVGSLHNWYSDMGCEPEFTRPGGSQQDGMQWPAQHKYQDNQASKGLWFGTQNFIDENANYFPYKVVHVGPRTSGANVFFPISLKMISRQETPLVYVNGILSFDKPIVNDSVDVNLLPDRVIENVVNTQIGITMTRKIMQFSNVGHDNYHIIEYTMKNSGNTDADTVIELPSTTLTDVYFFFLYRYAMTKQVRYVIGNATGWGANTMIDSRGDGTSNPSAYNDPSNENFRAQFAWHGYWPYKIVDYDNIGGPIWEPDYWSIQRGYLAESDTIGRLGAHQFVGVVTLHADSSSTNTVDDTLQPSTTGWYDSDAPQTIGNDPFNISRMTAEYQWMSGGNIFPRHAWQVEPTGNFAQQTADPGLGTTGGYSMGNGYGPYTLAPGESVKIVLAEAAAGLSPEKCIEIGEQYKNGQITATTKNEWVLTGRDSLFKTFRNALANYSSGLNLPVPPPSPQTFEVNSDSGFVELAWADNAVSWPNFAGYEIYRSIGTPYTEYEKIFACGTNTNHPTVVHAYNDSSVQFGDDYYYYIVAFDDGSTNNGIPMRSNMFYTRTYDMATSLTPTGINKSENEIPSRFELYQNFPNPFNPVTTIKYDLAKKSNVKLIIYDLLGREVQILVDQNQPSGEKNVIWNAKDKYGFKVASGVYLYKLIVRDDSEGKVNQYVKSIKMLLMK